MVFWSIVAGVVVLVLLVAWLYDRRRKASVNRHHPALEAEITQAIANSVTRPQTFGPGSP
jgi:cytochrome c-type biogenesis protein CcmH/NrfF